MTWAMATAHTISSTDALTEWPVPSAHTIGRRDPRKPRSSKASRTCCACAKRFRYATKSLRPWRTACLLSRSCLVHWQTCQLPPDQHRVNLEHLSRWCIVAMATFRAHDDGATLFG